MKRLFGTPICLLAALALAACGGEEKPPKKSKPKDPPTAALSGPTEPLTIGERVVVSGEASQGAGELTYHWTLHAPEGSEATFEFEGQSRNAFTVDAGGTFTVELVVADANGESEPATHDVRVAYAAPTAALELIAPEPAVALEDEIVADGGGSTDPAGQPLSYQFRLTQRPIGSQAAIEANGAKASFMPDRGGTYEVGLRVKNETTVSDEVTQSIVVEAPHNRAPVANAGKDSGGHPPGAEVILDASLSTDPDGDELSYAWSFLSQPEASEATLVDADQKTATFIPDLEGDYEIELEVSDGEFQATDTVRIGVKEITNLPPQITEVRLDGRRISRGHSESVPLDEVVEIEVEVHDESPQSELTMNWEVAGPAGSAATFGDVSEFKKTFEADIDGVYAFVLTANDGELDSNPFSFSLNFRGENRLPVAVLKTADGLVSYPNQTEITLDGTDSHDTDEPEDALVLYEWKLLNQPGLPTQSLDQSGEAPAIDFRMEKKGTYEFQLIVTDRMGGVSEPDTIEIESLNRPPVADARVPDPEALGKVSLDRLAEDPPLASEITLDAIAPGNESSDPDGDVLLYEWAIVDQPEGSNPCLGLGCVSVVNSSGTSFYTDMAGSYEVKLTVRDQDPVNPLSDELVVPVEVYE